MVKNCQCVCLSIQAKQPKIRRAFAFFVRVVEDKSGIRVLAFGPLKLVSGKLPAWAR